MKKTFIIDGYNVIHMIPELAAKLGGNLESARTALAIEIAGWKRRYADVAVYIVFDGSKGDIFDHTRAKICGIDCIFTMSGESADDRITNIVRKAKDPFSITVISDDNEVRNICRAHRAQVKHASFLQMNRKKFHRPSRPVKEFDHNGKSKEVTDYYREYLRAKGVI